MHGLQRFRMRKLTTNLSKRSSPLFRMVVQVAEPGPSRPIQLRFSSRIVPLLRHKLYGTNHGTLLFPLPPQANTLQIDSRVLVPILETATPPVLILEITPSAPLPRRLIAILATPPATLRRVTSRQIILKPKSTKCKSSKPIRALTKTIKRSSGPQTISHRLT